MGVKVGKKALAGGRFSVFLDYNYKGKRWKEYTSIILEKPVSKETRERNKEMLRVADSIRAKRELEALAHRYDLKELKAELKRDTDFIKYFEKFTANYTKADIRLVEASLRNFKQYIQRSEIPASAVTRDVCRGFMEYLQKLYKGNTPSNYFAKFKRCIIASMEDDHPLFEKSPTVGIRCVINQTTRHIKETLTNEELIKLGVTPCGSQEVKRAFLFSCNTGIRWSDLKELRYQDIHSDGRGNYVEFTQQKVEHSSSVATVAIFLNETAKEILSQTTGKPEEKIFKLKTHNAALHALKYWMKRADIQKHITFHCARHTFITNLTNEGTSFKTAADLAGHSTPRQVIDTYSHSNDQLKKEAVARLPIIEIRLNDPHDQEGINDNV